MKKLLFLLPVLALVLTGCNKTPNAELIPAATIVTGTETYMEEEVLLPTTGEISAELKPQPTELAGNYTDNGIMLRAWAEKNQQFFQVPAEAKNVKIGFVFANNPKYDAIPGNLQLSINWENLCNGRLTNKSATIDFDTNTYWYSFDNVSTQDKPNGVDLTSAIGKTLGIKVWIGESRNYVTKVILSYDL